MTAEVSLSSKIWCIIYAYQCSVCHFICSHLRLTSLQFWSRRLLLQWSRCFLFKDISYLNTSKVITRFSHLRQWSHSLTAFENKCSQINTNRLFCHRSIWPALAGRYPLEIVYWWRAKAVKMPPGGPRRSGWGCQPRWSAACCWTGRWCWQPGSDQQSELLAVSGTSPSRPPEEMSRLQEGWFLQIRYRPGQKSILCFSLDFFRSNFQACYCSEICQQQDQHHHEEYCRIEQELTSQNGERTESIVGCLDSMADLKLT